MKMASFKSCQVKKRRLSLQIGMCCVSSMERQPHYWTDEVQLCSLRHQGSKIFEKLKNDYYKEFVVPVWTVGELWQYNKLLKVKKSECALSEDELEKRYYVFGRIVPSIYSCDPDSKREELDCTITMWDVIQVVDCVQTNRSVKRGHFSERLLQVVPADEKAGRTSTTLSFLSDYIGEKVVAVVERGRLEKLSVFAVTRNRHMFDPATTLRGEIYELLVHKWLVAQAQLNLDLHPLRMVEYSTNRRGKQVLMCGQIQTTIAFSKPSEICNITGQVTYYHPKERASVD